MVSLKMNMSEPQRRKMVQLGAGFCFVIVGWLLAIHPVLNEINAYKTSARTAKQKSVIISDIVKLRQERQAISEMMSTAQDRSALISHITRIGNENGIEIESLSPSTEEAGAFTKLTFRVSGYGNYINVLKFLASIETTLKQMATTAFTMTDASRSAGAAGSQRIELILQTYLSNANSNKSEKRK